jgi:hypothetical protein
VPSIAPTTAVPSSAPTVAPTLLPTGLFVNDANLTAAPIAAAGGTARAVDLTNGTGLSLPGGRVLDSLGLSVMNLNSAPLVLTDVHAFDAAELANTYTRTPEIARSCGALPGTNSRAVAMFHITADTPTDVLARLSITLGNIGYTHPGRALYMCNSTAIAAGSWVNVVSLVNGTTGNLSVYSDTNGRDVVFHVPIGHTTPHVLLDDAALDEHAVCAPGYCGCQCRSTDKWEDGKVFTGLVILAGLFYTIAIVGHTWLTFFPVDDQKPWFTHIWNAFAWIANLFIWVAVSYNRAHKEAGDRNPDQYLSATDESWALGVLFVMSFVGWMIIALVVTGPVNASNGKWHSLLAPARLSGAVVVMATVISAFIIVSPRAHPYGPSGMSNPNANGMLVACFFAAALAIEAVWAVAEHFAGGFEHTFEDLKADWKTSEKLFWAFLRCLCALITVGVVVTYVLFLVLVPCGNTPRF